MSHIRADRGDSWIDDSVSIASPPNPEARSGGTANAGEAASSTRPVIELDHVWLSFTEVVLRDVSLEVRTGETLLIAGESGSGKTTILKLILRLLVPDQGRVLVGGRDITHLSFDDALAVRSSMGMVFQGAALFDSLTVFDNVAYPLRERRDISDVKLEETVREKLSFVDLDPEEVRDRLPSELSGGMKKRVGIARALSNNPIIMLFDEPTSGLDPLTTGTIVRLIQKLQRELGVTSIVVSHDLRSILPIASRIAILSDQQIIFDGTSRALRESRDEYIRSFVGDLR
jgi:phospholipid/cholesterol/gamma-HCH transport system ATP-binding protein